MQFNELQKQTNTNIQEKANLIWESATHLVGLFKPHEYGKVILPMTVLKRFDDALAPTKQFFVSQGNIIFPIVGSLGRAMYITADMPEGIINQRLAKFRIDESRVDKDYFLYLFAKSDFYKPFLDVHSRGAIIVNLTKEIVYNMPFIIPPVDEQREIVSYLDEKCA